MGPLSSKCCRFDQDEAISTVTQRKYVKHVEQNKTQNSQHYIHICMNLLRLIVVSEIWRKFSLTSLTNCACSKFVDEELIAADVYWAIVFLVDVLIRSSEHTYLRQNV